ncbi:MAG: ABC transporter ATP-binding protein [Thermoplasmata archaeon]
MGNAIEVHHLTKAYAHATPKHLALNDVSLTIPSGQVYGLIGRNGAGKTTFVRICATQLAPTSGTVRVLGRDALRTPRDVRSRIAAVPQESRPLYFVRVDELIYTYLRIRGMARETAHDRTESILAQLQLTGVRKTIVNRLSGGMRRRAIVAMVLATDAELVFLDEPTTGLDPIARREVWAAVRRAQVEHRTILLTTHYLDEAEELSARLALLENGEVRLEGTPADIRARVALPFRVTIEGAPPTSDLEPYGTVTPIEGGCLVYAREQESRELAMLALNRGWKVSLAPVSLEDIFLQVVGRPLDAEGDSPNAEPGAAYA